MQESLDAALEELGNVVSATNSKSGNFIQGIGGVSQILPLNNPNLGFFWTRDLLDTFVMSFWQCDRVVSCKPMAMGSAWGHLTVSDGNPIAVDAVNKRLRSLRRKYVQAQILANQHGGSTIIRLVEDGKPLREEIERNRINSIKYSRVFDRWECYPDFEALKANPTDPEYYLINALGSPDNLIRVHKSRVVRFDGEFISTHLLLNNQGWHASKLIRFLPSCMRYLEATGYVANAMKSFEMVLFMVDDLFKKISTPLGKNQVMDRARLNQEMTSSLRGLLCDRKSEDVKVVSRTFTGTEGVIEQLKQEMMGASGLDEIELFHKHPSGLGQTGLSQRLEKAKETKQLCDYFWGDLIEEDVRLILESKDSPFLNSPMGWAWEWNEDVVITPEEKGKIYYYFAQADKTYLESGVMSPSEVRSRFSGNSFKTEVVLSDGLLSTASAVASSDSKKEPKLIIDDFEKAVLPDSEFEAIASNFGL